MKIAIFFLLTLAADGSNFKCKGGKEPVQKKDLVINTTLCSGKKLGKAFRRNYTQGAEKCCDLKFACLQICGINEKKCNKFGRLGGGSPDCDPAKRCNNERLDKRDACKRDYTYLQDKVEGNFGKQPCTCKTENDVPNLREKVLNVTAGADKDCLKNMTVNYKDNTEVAKWFLEIIKKKVIGTNFCADFEKMRVMAVEIDSDSSTVLANQ